MAAMAVRATADRTALVQLYSQEVRSTSHERATSRLVVSEDLWFACVLNGPALDFYDLTLRTPEDSLRSLPFLCTTRLGDSVATEAAISPHDPTLLAVGTANGTLSFLRLRRTHSPSSIVSDSRPSGPLLVHKTLEKTLFEEMVEVDDLSDVTTTRSIDAIRFHPTQRNLCAVACAGAVHLVQHDVGLLAATVSCVGASPTCSLAWCGPLLACGEAGGAVRMWRLAVTLVDPRTPTTGLRVDAEPIGVLAPPVNAAPAAVSAMRWLPIEAKAGAEEEKDAAPLGVLCCGYTSVVPFDDTTPISYPMASSLPHTATSMRAWSLSAKGEIYMLANLPVAPLRGAVELLFSDTLAPAPLPASSEPAFGEKAAARDAEAFGVAALAAANSQPLRARSFRAAAEPRWVLCGAVGSPNLFAMPWGRASERPSAEATFPTAVELLCAPSVELDPKPALGVRGIHRIASDTCRSHVAEALGIAADSAACELALVLSDKALHVVLQATTPAEEEDVRADDEVEADTDALAGLAEVMAAAEIAAAAPVAERPGARTPLLGHLLPQVRPSSPDLPKQCSVVSGASPGKRSDSPPSSDTAALHQRIAELERRAIDAEERLGDLATSFDLFASQSRTQTNALLAALETLAAERKGSQ